MIILMKPEAKLEEVTSLIEMIKNLNAEPIYVNNENAICVVPNSQEVELSQEILKALPCVEKIVYDPNYSKVV